MIGAADVALGNGLCGTQTVPEGARDAVLIVPGSGPVDRDGNAPALGLRSDCYRRLAEGLAARGIAALRVDKRGVGRSVAVREDLLTIATYADDVTAWVDFLQERRLRVFLLGHSEGALLATLAARRRRVAGLVLVGGAGRPIGSILRRQLRAAGLSSDLLSRADACLADLEKGQAVATPPAELAGLFRPSVQPFMMSWLRQDPVKELAALTLPTLVVHGGHDLQVEAEDAVALAGCRPGIVLETIAGMNHVLKAAPIGRENNLAAYGDPSLPLAPGLMAVVARFIATQDMVLPGALR